MPDTSSLVLLFSWYTLFFIRTGKFDLKLAVLKYCSIFSLKYSKIFLTFVMLLKPTFAIGYVYCCKLPQFLADLT